MKIYLVGGAVRDKLLNLPVRDRDWVVVGATVAQMLALGFKQPEAEFPVFLHPQSGEEYALARRETKTAPGYKGFAVDASPEVTLEQDLQRRDLTINAMAEARDGTLIDPFNGREDLEQGLLRHVSPAFVEDPVRLLRVARFAARLGRWGFRVSHGTQALLRRMAEDEELQTLHGERLWRQMRAALAEEQPWRFFEVLQRCGALRRLIPALDRVMPGTAAHAAPPADEPTAALRRAARRTGDPRVRFAVAFYPAARAEGTTQWLQALCAERAYAELLGLALRWVPRYPAMAGADGAVIMDLFDGCRALQDASHLDALAEAAESLRPETQGMQATLRLALERARAVTPAAPGLHGLGGRALGEALRAARVAEIDALLAAG